MRKIRLHEKTHYDNPIRHLDRVPYLVDEIWPLHFDSHAGQSAQKVLSTFHCEERVGGVADVDALERFLRDPQYQLFIIWGQVGIGKTWFVRYQLLVGRCNMWKLGYHAGIVEMLRRGFNGACATLYDQLSPILESYFKRFFVSTESTLMQYAASREARTKGKAVGELRASDFEAVKSTFEEWQRLRDRAPHAYVAVLLQALEYLDGPMLFLVIDNIDNTTDEEQEKLAELAIRVARNPRIRLIVPLRRTSLLLANEFSTMSEVGYGSMELHPVLMREMLRLRFEKSGDGRSLANDPIIRDLDKCEYTFPQLFTMIFGEHPDTMSDTGELLLNHAGANARELVALTRRVMLSDHLGRISNVVNAEFAVAALMLTDASEPDQTASPILNLFNNSEVSKPGNSLVRFRTLEYFWKNGYADTRERHFQEYVRRGGYEEHQVKDVLRRFLMAGLLFSPEGVRPDRFKGLSLDSIGRLELTPKGKHFRKFLDRLWYWVCVKKDVYVPDEIIRLDDRGIEYIRHTDFVAWLKYEEETERIRVAEISKRLGPAAQEMSLISPHSIASAVLTKSKAS